MMQQTISDDGLVTLLVKIESILNSHPLTPVTMDSEADVPLTPNHLLLLHEFSNLPPGTFLDKDKYSTKCWCQIQYLSEHFEKSKTTKIFILHVTRCTCNFHACLPSLYL